MPPRLSTPPPSCCQLRPKRQKLACPCSDSAAHPARAAAGPQSVGAPPAGRGQAPCPPHAMLGPHRLDPPSTASPLTPLKERHPRRRPLFPCPPFSSAPTTPQVPRPSLLRLLPWDPPKPPKTVGVTPPMKHHGPEPTPPPRRHATTSVHHHRYHLAWCLPLYLRELSPLVSPHLITRLDTTGHNSPPPRGDHSRCACVARRPSWLS
jgi:hypothetical protein